METKTAILEDKDASPPLPLTRKQSKAKRDVGKTDPKARTPEFWVYKKAASMATRGFHITVLRSVVF